jgi:translation elongation factor EF-G
VKVELVTPEDYTDFVIRDLKLRCGQIQGQDMCGNVNVINAMVPLVNLFGHVKDLRSMSHSRATLRCDSITTQNRLSAQTLIHRFGRRRGCAPERNLLTRH